HSRTRGSRSCVNQSPVWTAGLDDQSDAGQRPSDKRPDTGISIGRSANLRSIAAFIVRPPVGMKDSISGNRSRESRIFVARWSLRGMQETRHTHCLSPRRPGPGAPDMVISDEASQDDMQTQMSSVSIANN